MLGGIHGKILHIDLTSGKTRVEEPLEIMYRLLVGGRALVAYLLLRDLAPNTDELSPDNLLILAPGILQGTNLPGADACAAAVSTPLFDPEIRRYSAAVLYFFAARACAPPTPPMAAGSALAPRPQPIPGAHRQTSGAHNTATAAPARLDPAQRPARPHVLKNRHYDPTPAFPPPSRYSVSRAAQTTPAPAAALTPAPAPKYIGGVR